MSSALARAELSVLLTRSCEGCVALARELLPGFGKECVCGAWIEAKHVPAPSPSTWRKRREPRHRAVRMVVPSAIHERVRRCVEELLRWHLAVIRLDHSQGSSFTAVSQGSSFTLVAEQLRLGALGSGNKGTKGVWHGPAPTPEEIPFSVITPDQETEARFKSLALADRETAEAVIEDGDGDKLVAVELVGRPWELSLSQRVSLRLVDMNQRARWLVKIKARDSAPALEGMRTRGEAALEALAGQWFAGGTRASGSI